MFLMVEYYLKVAEAEPMKTQHDKAAANNFSNRWICQHEVPEIMCGRQDVELNCGRASGFLRHA